MGYFAQIDDSDHVAQVISVSNDVLSEGILSYPETESVGRAFIANTLGLDGEWRQTSYNGSFRIRFAGVGYFFDRERDEFVPPEWSLVDGEWVAPPAPDGPGA